MLMGPCKIAGIQYSKKDIFEENSFPSSSNKSRGKKKENRREKVEKKKQITNRDVLLKYENVFNLLSATCFINRNQRRK